MVSERLGRHIAFRLGLARREQGVTGEGATRSGDMRNMMVLSLAAYIVAALILVPWLGNHGLWLALLVSFVARGVTLGLRYPALERAAQA